MTDRRPAPADRAAQRRRRKQQVRRRQIIAAVVIVLLAGALVYFAAGTLLAGTAKNRTPARQAAHAQSPQARTMQQRDAAKPSYRTRLTFRAALGGNISPKSVASSGTGLVFAQNMMYRHSVTVYDSRRMKLVKTISDAVRLSKLGYPSYRGTSRGAPVEAAFSPDHRYAYVSNYSMYGRGFGPEGSDTCTPSSGYDRSFVYRISLTTLKIDRAYRVGAVPKVVAVTNDGRFVLVSNWCTWDLSVISTRRGREVKRVSIGAYPRGIAVSPDGRAAYVAVMGGTVLVRVDLRTWRMRTIGIRSGPRAIVIAPSGNFVYATLNSEGRVAKLNLHTGSVLKVATGSAPRSMAIAPDGRSLYVVNYESGTVSKVRASDMRTLQTIDACFHPIGITYDEPTRRVWVACYGGSIRVYNDT